MCGIRGVLTFNNRVPSPQIKQNITKMTARIRHRGPDGEGVWSDDCAGLGHTRLAIVDLSEHGAQPMIDEGKSGRVLTFNGEIYNHVELRHQLEALGHIFKGHCDTEVILRGYTQWGPKVLSRLRGMFAFAIWDPKARELFMARDRMGQKPFFYSFCEDAFVFASEIKSLLAWPSIKRLPDYQAIDGYLSFGYTLGIKTGFENIHRLGAGQSMVVKNDGTFHINTYWAPPAPKSQYTGKPQDWINEFTHLLNESIRLRKVADVEVGAFLSGGVDSSAVCALLSKQNDARLSTFSVGFAREGYDETDAALSVATHLKTKHHSYTKDDRLLKDLTKIVWHYDMPYADSSALVSYGLSADIKKNVTVALSGDGADELLLGYPRYGRLEALERENGPPDTPLNRRRLSPFPERKPDLLDAYVYSLEKFRERQKIASYEHRLLSTLKHPFSQSLRARFDLRDGAQLAAARLDLSSYLVDDILVKMDIASMAHGLEVRSPFLDHHLVEWVCQLPKHCRTLNQSPKALLKEAISPYLPNGITDRAKMGFRVPVGQWLKKELYDLAKKLLLEDERFAARGLLRPQFVAEMMDAHCQGVEEHGSRLWALLMLELWFRTFIDRDGSQPLDDAFVYN